MPCFLVGMAAIGKMAIRSIVLSSRFGLFHLGKWTATKSAEFLFAVTKRSTKTAKLFDYKTKAIYSISMSHPVRVNLHRGRSWVIGETSH